MKRIYFEPFTPVRVTWVDAHDDSSSQANTVEEALMGYKPTIRTTTSMFMGYAKKGDEVALVLASDDDRDGEENSQMNGGHFFCPIGMVRSIQAIVPQTRKKRR